MARRKTGKHPGRKGSGRKVIELHPGRKVGSTKAEIELRLAAIEMAILERGLTKSQLRIELDPRFKHSDFGFTCGHETSDKYYDQAWERMRATNRKPIAQLKEERVVELSGDIANARQSAKTLGWGPVISGHRVRADIEGTAAPIKHENVNKASETLAAVIRALAPFPEAKIAVAEALEPLIQRDKAE